MGVGGPVSVRGSAKKNIVPSTGQRNGHLGRSGGTDRGNGKMTWAEAFLLQARSDYAIFKLLSGMSDTPEPFPMGDGLDMRRRLPDLLGRFSGNGCGHCQPLSERFIRPNPPRRTSGSQSGRVGRDKAKAIGARRMRMNFWKIILSEIPSPRGHRARCAGWQACLLGHQSRTRSRKSASAVRVYHDAQQDLGF
jgi:hypothetical protein